jgi:hypothetical protein
MKTGTHRPKGYCPAAWPGAVGCSGLLDTCQRIELLPAIEMMQQPVVVPAARALANDYRWVAQCRAHLWMAEGTSMNKSPSGCDRWRFEGEVQISALRSGALYREGSDLRLKSNVQHQIADPSCGKPSRSTRLKLETESSHGVCLTIAHHLRTRVRCANFYVARSGFVRWMRLLAGV